MSREEFDLISYHDLTLKISYFLFQESKEWEKVRYMAAITLNANRGPKQKVIAPEKLMKLPTDPKPQAVGTAFSELLRAIQK